MKNIELKIALPDSKAVIRNLKNIKAKFSGELNQIDTYYNCKKGRLKLREINKKNFELVYYERPDTKKSKVSDFQVLPIKSSQLKNIKSILSRALGEKVIVKKTRNLWLYKNTRIHIDKVRNLGNYLELETVVRKGIPNAKKEHQEVINLLGIANAKKINVSYNDLLLKQRVFN
jgi:adenylate cyclase, class 2